MLSPPIFEMSVACCFVIPHGIVSVSDKAKLNEHVSTLKEYLRKLSTLKKERYFEGMEHFLGLVLGVCESVVSTHPDGFKNLCPQRSAQERLGLVGWVAAYSQLARSWKI